jgi:hypothetical protein
LKDTEQPSPERTKTNPSDVFYHPVVGSNPMAWTRASLQNLAFVRPQSLLDKSGKEKKAVKDKIQTAICIVSQTEHPIDSLFRLVVRPAADINQPDQAYLDISGKLPFPAYYVYADKDTLKKLLWRNALTTAHRKTVTLPDDLLDQMNLALLKQALETLSLLKKSGQVLTGFAKIEEQLQKNPVGFYLGANDTSAHAQQKIIRLLSTQNSVSCLADILSSAQISASLGDDNIHHVLIKDCPLAQKFSHILNKLKAVR